MACPPIFRDPRDKRETHSRPLVCRRSMGRPNKGRCCTMGQSPRQVQPLHAHSLQDRLLFHKGLRRQRDEIICFRVHLVRVVTFVRIPAKDRSSQIDENGKGRPEEERSVFAVVVDQKLAVFRLLQKLKITLHRRESFSASRTEVVCTHTSEIPSTVWESTVWKLALYYAAVSNAR